MIVYAGAIMVLFVFVIMLLNAGEEERTPGQPCCACSSDARVLLLAGLFAWTLLAPEPASGR